MPRLYPGGRRPRARHPTRGRGISGRGSGFVGYLAFSVPAIAAGIAVGEVGPTRTAEVYAAAVAVLGLLAVAGLLRTRRAAGSCAPPSAPRPRIPTG